MQPAKQFKVKLKTGDGFLVPATIIQENNHLFFDFPYNESLLNEIRSMQGRKWHGRDEHNPRKMWSIPITQRNMFQLEYLSGKNPYARYDAPLKLFTPERPLREHQIETVAHGLQVHYGIWAEEMGLGKTLSAMELMERSGATNWLWVGPRSALRGVDLEFEKWNCKITPQFYTYEGMKKLITDWPAGKTAPQGVIFDESSRLKTFNSQRTEAAMELANGIREDHGLNGYVILMSGTPAPKSPADWWSQCEIACPGFLKEGDIYKFRERLGIFEKKEGATGSYNQHISWRDDERKCDKCGEFADHINHDSEAVVYGVFNAHTFVPSKNEVYHLSNRLKGLVLTKLKRNCLTLPEKQYEVIRLKPTQSMLNAAKLIKRVAPTSIARLTLLRELSDGFQYEKYEAGMEECPLCHGSKIYKEWYDPQTPDEPVSDEAINSGRCEIRITSCPTCSGTGQVVRMATKASEVPTPKEDLLKELLDKHSDVGRFVVYGGFTGAIDRIVGICHAEGWTTIRVDGRGWLGTTPNGEILPQKELLKIFQYGQKTHENVVFVGQPGAAGMGLTLTASPSIFYWSNTFNGEDRMQSEDRIHRLGMDENRGATIYDCYVLPSDEFVHENLKKKVVLQDMSLGELDEMFERVV